MVPVQFSDTDPTPEVTSEGEPADGATTCTEPTDEIPEAGASTATFTTTGAETAGLPSLLDFIGMFLNHNLSGACTPPGSAKNDSAIAVDGNGNGGPAESDSEKEGDDEDDDEDEEDDNDDGDEEDAPQELEPQRGETTEEDFSTEEEAVEGEEDDPEDTETARIWFTLSVLQYNLRNSTSTSADFWNCLLHPFVCHYFPQFSPGQRTKFIRLMQQGDLNQVIEQIF